MGRILQTSENTIAIHHGEQMLTDSMYQTMLTHKSNMVDLILYNPPRHKNGKVDGYKCDAILSEIKKVEAWLKAKSATLFL